MPKPDSLNRVEGKAPTEYTIKSEDGTTHKIYPTDTKDGSHLIIIKGTGTDIWGIKDKDFPERPIFGGGSATAIAVLNKKDELLGIAIGRVDGNGITVDRIQYNDGAVKEIDKISVRVSKSKDGHSYIENDDAEKLSQIVLKAAEKYKESRIKSREITAMNDMPKFEVANVKENSPPLHAKAAGPKTEIGLG